MRRFFSLHGSTPDQAVIVRIFVVFIVSSVALFIVLTVLLLLPRINQAFNDLQDQSDKISVNAYAAQLYQYIDDRRLSLMDVSRNPILINNMLLGDQGKATLKDFIASLRLLCEDPDVVLLDFSGNVTLSEQPAVHRLYEDLVAKLLQGEALFALNLISREASPRFEMALPIFYCDSR